MINKSIKNIFYLYLISLPLVSAFSVTQIVTPPLVLSLLIFGVLILRLDENLVPDKHVMKVCLFFVVPAVLSALFSIGISTVKTASHLSSYFATWLLFYTVPYICLKAFIARNEEDKVIYCVYLGWIVANLFCVVEFILINVFKFSELNNLIPRPAVNEYNPLVAGYIVRARSFAEESAHFMLYSGMMFFFLKQKGTLTKKDHLLFYASTITTFGVAAWFALLASWLAIAMLKTITELDSKVFLKVKTYAYLITSLAFIGIGSYFLMDLVGQEVSAKLSGRSMGDRLYRILETFEFYEDKGLFSHIFGLGPGYYDFYSLPSVVSLPLLTFFQCGIFGLVLLLSLLVIYYIRSASINVYLFGAIVFSSVCYLSISNYWFPWIWFLFAYIDAKAKSRAI